MHSADMPQRIKAKAKADIYAFLSSIFLTEPTEGQVSRFKEVSEILKTPFPDSFSIDELKREYFDLFMIPNPRYVKPYESVYRDRIAIEFVGNPELGVPPRTRYIRGLLFQKSAQEVSKFYRQEGIYPEKELPDHIGNELSFMAYLALKESEAPVKEAEKFKKLQEDFKKKHLLKWVNRLEKKISKYDRLGYYKNAVLITKIMLEQ